MRAIAGTPVERGDVLFVSVSGAPEMTRDAKVDADGRIRLPVLGGIDVAGADVDEIQRRIEAALVARDIMLSPVVLVEVSSYRPIYVGGAVKVSGEVPYQPGLTVRQALIAAGGFDLLQNEKSADVGNLLELLARRQATIQNLAQSDSQIARLKAQLAEDTQSQDAQPKRSDAGPDVILGSTADAKQITPVDRDLLGALGAQRKADRAYADTAVSLVQLELDVLTQQSELQKKERDLQRQEVENTSVMVEKGLVPLPRLTDLKREESRLSRDLLENYAFAARARQDIERIRHDTSAADAQTRIQVLEDYRKALQDHAALEAEIDIINGHLLAVGRMASTQGGRGDVVPEVVIHRSVGGAATQLTVTMETDLQPGDVLDVKLPDIPRG
ncbi:MAG: polysaccharide biosynthesis/export family protein [Cypionkella sp.]